MIREGLDFNTSGKVYCLTFILKISIRVLSDDSF